MEPVGTALGQGDPCPGCELATRYRNLHALREPQTPAQGGGRYWGIPFQARPAHLQDRECRGTFSPDRPQGFHPPSQPDHWLLRQPAGSLEENPLEVALRDG